MMETTSKWPGQSWVTNSLQSQVHSIDWLWGTQPAEDSMWSHDVDRVCQQQDRWWEQLDGPTPTFL